MSIHLTDRVYHLGFGLGLLNLGLTLVLALQPGSRWSRADRWLLLTAAGTVLLCLAASLYNSWTFDYQPQGRYLFGAVGALTLPLWGQWETTPRWTKLARPPPPPHPVRRGMIERRRPVTMAVRHRGMREVFVTPIRGKN